MTCAQCGKTMTVARENVKYDASGLPGITLERIEVRKCRACGESELVIPRIEELHALIAQVLIKKTSRLTPAEIKYLRKTLGWSGIDFARMMGATPETVSRWESGRTPMGVQADRLLRVMVAHLQPVREYSQDQIERSATAAAKPSRLNLTNDARGWHPRAA